MLAWLWTRLSEDGARVSISGRALSRFPANDIERLLRAQVLIEERKADTWSVCAECDCGLDARPVDLGSYRGRPVVLNLWATWCPPCRREMPAFEQAQAAFPKVAFVMVNQGESAQHARAFLEREGLTLTDVLLDPSSRTMQEMGTRGLPTTLFFDTQGQLVASHVGELTIASLKDAIGRHFGRSLQSGTER